MYKNLKISKKLIIGYSSVSILSIVMMVFALSCLSSVGKLSHELYTGPYVSTTEAMGIRRDLNVIGKELRSAILAKDLDKYLPAIEEARAEMDKRVVVLKAVFGGDIQLITNFENSIKILSTERDKVCAAIEAGDYEKATDVVLTSYYEAFKVSTDAANAIYDDADVRGQSFDTTAQKTASISMIISIILLIIGLIISFVMALVSTRSITRPLKKVEDAMKQITEGSLNITVDYESKDELGNLAQGMHYLVGSVAKIVGDVDYLLGEMANGNFDIKSKARDNYIGDYAPILTSLVNINTKLSDALSQINIASDQVSSGSDQVSSGAQALSQGATEQASSVEELAATITEISAQIRENADNAKEASGKTNEAGEEITISNKKMQELIVAMDEISKSSSEIGKVIKAIEDIAFQTNILALNAAVEAARAGAAGKGFAVVADEVRNLASKSATAAKSTTALIEGSVKAVEKGTKLADDTAKSLVSVVEGTSAVAVIVDKIATASQEQAESISQVTMGIDQISSVVQTNSATAEESAAASEELSGQAEMLKELVGKFTLKNQGSSYQAPKHSKNTEHYYKAMEVPTMEYSVNEPMPKQEYYSDGKY